MYSFHRNQDRKRRSPKFKRRIKLLLFLGITVLELVFGFVLCFRYNLNPYHLQWAVNWTNMLLQDLLLAPTSYLLCNYFVLLLVIRNRRISKDIKACARKLLDVSLIGIHAVLDGKELPKTFEVASIQANTVQVEILKNRFKFASHSFLKPLSKKTMNNHRKHR